MNKIFKFGNVLMASVVACCVSCNSSNKSSHENQGSEVDFSLSLFKNLLAVSSTDENVTLSPYSAGVALSMLAEGADGVTLQELDKALEGCRLKAENLGGNDSVTVTSANSLWTNADYQVKAKYVDVLNSQYGALAQSLDFSDVSSVDKINSWARENTAGKIDNVVNELSPDMVALLANAVYFKGAWASPFNPRSTKTRTFHGTKADKDVPFMSQTATFNFVQYYGNQMIRIPYWGEDYAMTIILPSEGFGVEKVKDFISSQNLDMAVSMLRPTKVKLFLPKFKVEGDKSLVPVLQKMGVKSAFEHGAQLSGIADGPLAVSDVKQKTFVNVDERGSEAAAVTTIGVSLTSMPNLDFEVMDVNRPFYYMISDVNSGRILFIGRVCNF